MQTDDNDPARPSSAAHVGDMPTNESVEDMPTNESVEDMPTNESVEDMPTNESVEDMPTNESVEDAPTKSPEDTAPAGVCSDPPGAAEPVARAVDRAKRRRAERFAARREEMLLAVRRVAGARGVTALSRDDFRTDTGIPSSRVYHYFKNWTELCELAGIEARRPNLRLSDNQIFSAMRDAFLEAGEITPAVRFRRYFRHSTIVLQSRGLNWADALQAFRAWAEVNDPDFPYMGELPEPARENGAGAGKGGSTGESAGHSRDRSRGAKGVEQARPGPRVWPALAQGTAGDAAAMGELIHFRGMTHAPVNEQGVVLLFGAVARDLGYAVEAVRTAFPDCLAKRRVSGGRWQRVRVEFEYRSRSFVTHGHDPEGCDVVVCWTHDWPGCPLEVLELKSAIAGIAGV